MEILNRTQITDVVVKRTVSHEVEHEGEAYIRYSTVTTAVPYMDHDVKVLSVKIKWQKRINVHQVLDISKKEVKTLELEKWFGYSSPREMNGNVVNYYDLVHKRIRS